MCNLSVGLHIRSSSYFMPVIICYFNVSVIKKKKRSGSVLNSTKVVPVLDRTKNEHHVCSLVESM